MERKAEYEAPTITVTGSLHELTQMSPRHKYFNPKADYVYPVGAPTFNFSA